MQLMNKNSANKQLVQVKISYIVLKLCSKKLNTCQCNYCVDEIFSAIVESADTRSWLL